METALYKCKYCVKIWSDTAFLDKNKIIEVQKKCSPKNNAKPNCKIPGNCETLENSNSYNKYAPVLIFFIYYSHCIPLLLELLSFERNIFLRYKFVFSFFYWLLNLFAALWRTTYVTWRHSRVRYDVRRTSRHS